MISRKSLEEIVREIGDGRLKPEEVIDHFVERSEKLDSGLGVYISKCDVGHEEGVLKGIPFAIKDNMELEGTKTTCGSRILENYESTFTSTAVEKLRSSGATVIGKTNMDEFAMGSSTEYSAFFSTKNPWDRSKVPGGSSGGSAAAVAAGMVPFALGSDTGGSIRQPASFCGIVGYKPTYGLVSRYGLVAFASSLDQIGPLTRTVRDAALVGGLMFGKDPRDATTVEREMDLLGEIENGIEGMRFALPVEFTDGLGEETRAVMDAAVEKLRASGATVEKVSVPSVKYAVSVYYIIAPSEASSNLSRYDGIRYGLRKERGSVDETYMETRDEGFGAEVKRRIMLGTFTLSATYYDAYFDKAQKVRAKITDELSRTLEGYDAIIGPTTPAPAFKFGELSSPLDYYLQDIYTIPANLAGFPAISVPMGFVGGMPIGMQIMGTRFEDAKVLRIARSYEKARGAFPVPEDGE